MTKLPDKLPPRRDLLPGDGYVDDEEPADDEPLSNYEAIWLAQRSIDDLKDFTELLQRGED